MTSADFAIDPSTGPTIAEVRELSRLTKEEWREYTKTVWQIANVTHTSHPAPFPVEIPRRLVKLFSLYGETVLDPYQIKLPANLPPGRYHLAVGLYQSQTQQRVNASVAGKPGAVNQIELDLPISVGGL